MSDKKIFFCHASEDATTVDAIYKTVIRKYPQMKPWLDRYEIVGGDSLIEKIAAGIEEADKFFIFLSEETAAKPWVTRELRKAIMREIDEVNPDFIVPVKLGVLQKLPAFLEDKHYIDIEKLTEEEWLLEFEAAINGIPVNPSSESVENLEAFIELDKDNPAKCLLWIKARHWSEPVSFYVSSTVDFISATYLGSRISRPGVEGWRGSSGSNVTLIDEARLCAVTMDDRLNAGEQVAFEIELPAGSDPRQILRAGRATS